MKKTWIAIVGFGVLAACGGKVDSIETQGQALSSKCAPSVPANIAVPDGNKVEMSFDAIGVQIYDCTATGWVFRAPEATLYNPGGQEAGIHYVGPTWQADDGSSVKGAKVAAYSADPNSIPWLLLKAVEHDGDGRMSHVTYVQRLDTSGGNAPKIGCDADHVGDVARVDYTATYWFFEDAQGEGDPGNCN